MTENITVYALWEQTSNKVNTIIKDRIYMTDEEIEIRTEILKRQYPPTLSNNQITKPIQLLQELLKQAEVQPQPTTQPTQTAKTYIEGFGYVSQGNTTTTTIWKLNWGHKQNSRKYGVNINTAQAISSRLLPCRVKVIG